MFDIIRVIDGMMAMGNKRGFTLIEIVVSLVITVIVAAMAMNALSGSTASRDLDNAAIQLEQDLRWMQQVAINSDKNKLPIMTFFNTAPFGYIIQTGAKTIKPQIRSL